jgi:chromate transporter
MRPDIAPPRPAAAVPTLFEVFVAFVIISLSGFGGVLAWSRRMLVEERKWMTEEEFNDAYSVCQFLPGPNIINLSVVFGRQAGGVAGALAALAGLISPAFTIMVLFAFLYGLFGDLDIQRRMFTGVAAAAAGLTISTSLKMASAMFRGQSGLAPLVALGILGAVGVMRWPIYWVVLVAAPVSIAIAWWSKP